MAQSAAAGKLVRNLNVIAALELQRGDSVEHLTSRGPRAGLRLR